MRSDILFKKIVNLGKKFLISKIRRNFLLAMFFLTKSQCINRSVSNTFLYCWEYIGKFTIRPPHFLILSQFLSLLEDLQCRNSNPRASFQAQNLSTFAPKHSQSHFCKSTIRFIRFIILLDCARVRFTFSWILHHQLPVP